MEIKVISDTHNDHDKLELGSGDILIHCGDFGTKGNYTEAVNFLWWFVKQRFKYKIVVPGNHDHRFKIHPDVIKLTKALGIIHLKDSGIKLGGVEFYGIDFCCGVRDGEYSKNQETRRAAWENMSYNTDVLITHMPPKGILSENEGGEDCGCDELLKKVMEIKPSYHLYGHIHEFGGQSLEKDGIKFMNCALKDRRYKLRKAHYFVINIGGELR